MRFWLHLIATRAFLYIRKEENRRDGFEEALPGFPSSEERVPWVFFSLPADRRVVQLSGFDRPRRA
jgi:hypothetical protein